MNRISLPPAAGDRGVCYHDRFTYVSDRRTLIRTRRRFFDDDHREDPPRLPQSFIRPTNFIGRWRVIREPVAELFLRDRHL